MRGGGWEALGGLLNSVSGESPDSPAGDLLDTISLGVGMGLEVQTSLSRLCWPAWVGDHSVLCDIWLE